MAGEPPGFGELKRIIEDILPPHLDIQYHFWYLTWAELEDKFSWLAGYRGPGPDLVWSGDLCNIEKGPNSWELGPFLYSSDSVFQRFSRQIAP